MNLRKTSLMGVVALAFSGALFAQTSVDRAFSATGASCDQVTWSEEALEQYPRIASACREVTERDGKYFVRFEGEVDRVRDRGRSITVDFREGDRLTISPPDNLSIFIDGRRTSAANLRPGDQLNFYIPQDQLVATFFDDESETATAQEAPITPEPEETLARTEPQSQSRLPGTASPLPLLGFAGLILLVLGAALTIRRLTRQG
ncbi:MAG TPA: hypothetical protein VKZ91_00755 [Woeseiaceae bacterium]|nr:hypothetical protein [Woeseiaceae bacterium]